MSADNMQPPCCRAMARAKVKLVDRQLACMPIGSPEGRDYLGAMQAAANFAFGNRWAGAGSAAAQLLLAHLRPRPWLVCCAHALRLAQLSLPCPCRSVVMSCVRKAFAEVFGKSGELAAQRPASLPLLLPSCAELSGCSPAGVQSGLRGNACCHVVIATLERVGCCSPQRMRRAQGLWHALPCHVPCHVSSLLCITAFPHCAQRATWACTWSTMWPTTLPKRRSISWTASGAARAPGVGPMAAA